jgi:hypothetical protein
VVIYTLRVVGDDGGMKLRRRSLSFLAMAIVVSLPLLGMSGVASAKAAKGCHKTHSCKSGGGTSTGSGTGADPAPITVQIDPNPLVETGSSDVDAVIQVETSPAFAGDFVDISASQLYSACDGRLDYIGFERVNPGPGSVEVRLDDDGNASVVLEAFDCAPGSSVIEADLVVAPYYTALATLNVLPPVVTTPGVYGYPTTSGTVTGGEVETGDTSFVDDGSYVYAVFYVETSPVYAEQQVEISSSQLQARCGTDWEFYSDASPSASSGGEGSHLAPGSPATATATLDDEGNATFIFYGGSCAAGTSTVIADVLAGTHQTYTTTFTVLSPQPTI